MIKKIFAFMILAGLLLVYCNLSVAREVKVAVFQFEVHSKEDLTYLQSGISSLVPSRITIPGKISVIDSSLVKKKLTKILQHQSLSEKCALAKTVGADFFLTGSITKIGNELSIDALLVDVLDPQEPISVFIQSTGFDDIIPEINKLSQKIKKMILEGPPLAEHIPASETTIPKENIAQSQSDTTPSIVSDEVLPSERLEEQSTIAESSLAESVVQEAQEYKPSQPHADRFAQLPPVFQSTPHFAYTIKGKPLHVLATGDTNGDGKKELLVAGEDKIAIYLVNQTALQFNDEIPTQLDENIVYIDAADINGNGVDEIYVTSYEGHYANSFVIEYIDGTYQRIAVAQKQFFRLYKQFEGNLKLIGQRAASTKPFSGTVDRFVWKDEKLVPREEFIFPGGTALYGFTEGDIDEDGSKEYLVFTKGLFSSHYQLNILSYTGRVKWRDLQKLGGSSHFFVQYLYGDDIDQKEIIPLRVLCEDYNNDGKLEVVVARNSKKAKGLLEKLIDYNQGEVLCLHWDGSDLASNWTSGILNNYVTDYIMEDFDEDQKKELYILSVKPEGILGKAANVISVFKQTSTETGG